MHDPLVSRSDAIMDNHDVIVLQLVRDIHFIVGFPPPSRKRKREAPLIDKVKEEN